MNIQLVLLVLFLVMLLAIFAYLIFRRQSVAAQLENRLGEVTPLKQQAVTREPSAISVSSPPALSQGAGSTGQEVLAELTQLAENQQRQIKQLESRLADLAGEQRQLRERLDTIASDMQQGQRYLAQRIESMGAEQATIQRVLNEVGNRFNGLAGVVQRLQSQVNAETRPVQAQVATVPTSPAPEGTSSEPSAQATNRSNSFRTQLRPTKPSAESQPAALPVNTTPPVVQETKKETTTPPPPDSEEGGFSVSSLIDPDSLPEWLRNKQ